MKTNDFNNFTKKLSVGLFLMISVNSFSQPNDIKCYLKNITYINVNNISFEIWLENTGTNSLKMEGFQGGINFNYSGLSNGGVITCAFVPGSADPSLSTEQQSPDWNINTVSKQIRMYAEIADYFQAPIIPASGGIRIGKCLLTNTVNFAQSSPNFVWSFVNGTGYTTQTVIDCYINGIVQGNNLTNPANFFAEGSTSIPTLTEWSLITLAILFLSVGIFQLKPKIG